MKTFTKKIPFEQGFTMIEVLVALVIFTGITAAVMKGLSVADRVKGRGSGMLYAVRLVNNETERIRTIAAEKDTINDTSYTGEVEGRGFTVERRKIKPDTPDLRLVPTIPKPWEVEIIVKDMATDLTVTFRLLQSRAQP